MVDFPAYVDGVPPTIALSDYDGAVWAKETAVHFDEGTSTYQVVHMEDQDRVIANFDEASGAILDKIFADAKKTYASENSA